ncbi:MAG: branched-chain amino acid ABC transporter permease [Treponema sp.]|nr:branched-chain amino acid ABC transporter permease [Treponema sp.]
MKNKLVRNTLLLGVCALFALVVPALLILVGAIDAYTAQVLIVASINAIMAISVNLICGITGQLSLGQAGFMAIGAYSTVLLSLNAHFPLPLAIITSGLITSCFGFLIGFPTLKLEGDYLAIVTLGFGEIIRVVLVNLKPITGGPNGKQFPTVLTLNRFLAFLVIAGSLIAIIILLQNFIRSTYGRAILAVREDSVAANSCGINIFKYKMIGFVLASFIAGIGGAFYVSFIGFVKPDQASFTKSIDYLIFVVLGGMGSMTGSVLSSFVLTFLQEFLRILQNYRMLIYPVILALVMIFRPSGLMGTKEFSFVKIFERIFARKNFTHSKQELKNA